MSYSELELIPQKFFVLYYLTGRNTWRRVGPVAEYEEISQLQQILIGRSIEVRVYAYVREQEPVR